MSVLKNFKQSASNGVMLGLVMGSAAGVIISAYHINKHQKTLDLHNQAIMLNTTAILALSTHVSKSEKSNNG